MYKPRTTHGCAYPNGCYVDSQKGCRILSSPFRKWPFFINPLNVRAYGSLFILRWVYTWLAGEILPLDLMGGRKGALHGGDLLSAFRKPCDLISPWYSRLDTQFQLHKRSFLGQERAYLEVG